MNKCPIGRKIHIAVLIRIIVGLIFPFVIHAWEGKVVGITDGDTIKVLKDGKQVKIRLASIDCPESGQPWGKKSEAIHCAYGII